MMVEPGMTWLSRHMWVIMYDWLPQMVQPMVYCSMVNLGNSQTAAKEEKEREGEEEKDEDKEVSVDDYKGTSWTSESDEEQRRALQEKQQISALMKTSRDLLTIFTAKPSEEHAHQSCTFGEVRAGFKAMQMLLAGTLSDLIMSASGKPIPLVLIPIFEVGEKDLSLHQVLELMCNTVCNYQQDGILKMLICMVIDMVFARRYGVVARRRGAASAANVLARLCAVAEVAAAAADAGGGAGRGAGGCAVVVAGALFWVAYCMCPAGPFPSRSFALKGSLYGRPPEGTAAPQPEVAAIGVLERPTLAQCRELHESLRDSEGMRVAVRGSARRPCAGLWASAAPDEFCGIVLGGSPSDNSNAMLASTDGQVARLVALLPTLQEGDR
eukprot:m51a1_g14092 hypothetical protein (383) ;mRNA; f:54585-69459